MAKLTEEIQTFIVQAHACFRKPSLIIKDVGAEFGVKLTRDQVQFYHPERGKKNKRLGKKHVSLFYATRKAFLDRKVEIGVAAQSYRLSYYQRAADFYEERGNYVLGAAMVEKAAKEVGGAYTNKHLLMVGELEGARRALAVMLTESSAEIEKGTITREQIVQMVASDHDVPLEYLASEAVN